MLTVGSLFAGIGGIDLGLERAGMQVEWQVENDPYCIRVLEKHWPSVKRYGDVRGVRWSKVEPVDLICGGFPCQPVSVAGSRKGDKDERWLWPEFLRAIREIRPKYALVENVPGLLSIDDGRLARGVFGDLAELGYDAEWNIISASDVGAPHLRKRIFIVAHSQSNLRGSSWNGRSLSSDGGDSSLADPEDSGDSRRIRFSANDSLFGPKSKNLSRGRSEYDGSPSDSNTERLGWSRHQFAPTNLVLNGFQSSQLCQEVANSECEGLLSEYISQARQTARYSSFEQQWAVEPDVGRVADGVPSRVDRLRCLGNAVVPQVAEFIGKTIIESISES